MAMEISGVKGTPAIERQLSAVKQKLIGFFDREAIDRPAKRAKHKYYYKLVESYFRFYVPEGASVLVIGCGSGELLAALKPGRGVGVDISRLMVDTAKRQFPQYEFHTMDAEYELPDEQFDVVILADVIGYFDDIQQAFSLLPSVCHESTRIMIMYYNVFWRFPLQIAEKMKLKMTQPISAWLELEDIANLLHLSGFEIIRKNFKILMPVYIPLISAFCNYFLANMPLLWRLSLVEIVSARIRPTSERQEKSVTVLVPTRNEKGNIAAAIERLPKFGTHQEIMFVDGHSTDGTIEEVERQIALHPDKDIKLYHQDGRGKGDAVRKGYGLAEGEILMILDADLTVPPEELPKFYEAIVTGKGEFINGSRLVYPLGERSMRFLNILGNKFFSMAFTYLLEQRFKDTLCGTKVLTKANYDILAANRHYFGDFDPFGDFDLIFGAAKLNLKIVEVPIRYRERVYGETKISRFKEGWILLQMCVYAYKKIKMI